MSEILKSEPRLLFSNVQCMVGDYGGTFTPTDLKSFENVANTNEENVKRVKERFDPIKVGENLLLFPGMPVTDVKFLAPSKEEKRKMSIIPSGALIQEKSGKVVGWKSGIRSCIVEDEGKMFRMKGCGNNSDYFPMRKVDTKKEEVYEIRGCMFQHTCFRELYMYEKINKMMRENGIPLSNDPVGFYTYFKDEKEFKKYCAVYETFGERRLNDHIILGLEQILPLILKVKDFEGLSSLFPKLRFAENPDDVTETWLGEFESDPLATYLLDAEKFFDFKGVEITIPEERPKFVDKQFEGIWDRCLEVLKKEEKDLVNIFPLLYFQLGSEVGNVLSVLHGNGTSWGTYTDDLGLHCNAHPNNLTLVLDDKKFLGALDFDMAFEKDSFISKKEGHSMKSTLKEEVNYMSLILGGSDANTGARGITNFKEKEMNFYLWALRDTLVGAMKRGYLKKVKEVEFSRDLAYALLTMGLIATVKDVA